MGTYSIDEMDRYRDMGYAAIASAPDGVTMVKPKRVSVFWLLVTGGIPYLIYHVLFKSERSVFVRHHASEDESDRRSRTPS
jgi:hypothetical protein